MLVANLIGPKHQTNGNAHASAPQTHDVVHPATGQVVHQMQKSTKVDIERAISTAHSALRTWSATSIQDRARIFSKAADLIETSEWTERLRDANIAETSVTFWWSSTQVSEVPNFLRELVRVAAETLKTEVVSYHGGQYLPIHYPTIGLTASRNTDRAGALRRMPGHCALECGKVLLLGAFYLTMRPIS